MPFQPVPNCAQAELLFWNGSSYIENVLHLYSEDVFNVTNMNGIAFALRTWWDGSLQGGCPSTLFLQKIIVKDLSSETAPAIEYTGGLPLPGSSESIAAPSNVTIAVKLLTGLRGRSYRGRIYHVGLTQGALNGDQIADSNWTSLHTAYTALVETAFEGLPFQLAVVSRYHNNVLRAAGVVTPVTGIELDRTLDSQRRRLATRGM